MLKKLTNYILQVYSSLIEVLSRIFLIFFYQGVCIETSDGVFLSYAMLLICTADLPARAKVANHVQFNGYYGCITCTVMGERIEAAVLTGAKVSMYTLCYVIINETFCYQVNGRKGIPILALHLPFNLILGMVIDIMHYVILGVVKALLPFWFSSTQRSQECSVYSQVSNNDTTIILFDLSLFFLYYYALKCSYRFAMKGCFQLLCPMQFQDHQRVY